MKQVETPRSLKHQYFAAIAANVVTFSYGGGVGWFSPALPMLQSDESPLETGAITLEDVSWIGSLLSVGCIVGNFLMGYLVPRIGSKHSIALLGLPQLTAWFCMIFGTNAFYLYAARFFLGVAGGGVEICVTLFVSEIADNDLRGRLGTFYSFSRSFGILSSFILGAYYDYIITAKIFTGIIILFYIVFSFLPPTPSSLIQRKKLEQAEKAFKFYRGYKEESKSCVAEFAQLKLAAESVKEGPEFKLKDLLESNARKGIIMGLIFPFLIQFAAAYIILTYGSNIINQAGTHLPLEVSSISLAVAQVLATFLTFSLVDAKGRKLPLILSLTGCALGHLIMAAYLYLGEFGFDTSAFHVLPIACMAFVVFNASVGIIPLTIICLIENFPPKVRSFGVTFASVTLNVINFIVIKGFPSLTEIIQLQGCLLIGVIGCVFGVIFVTYCVRETKGKDLNALKSDTNTSDNNSQSTATV